jgi:hypothetical protein
MIRSAMPITRSLSTFKYISNLGDDIKSKTTELSQKQLQSLVEVGTSQAINALDIIQKQLKEMNTESVTTSVTFNAGLLSVTFSTPGSKSSLNKQ